MSARCGSCQPVAYKHEDGWDIYRRHDCERYDRVWVPRWFDCSLVEDARTRAEAWAEWRELHPLGICLAGRA
jgi:hypothetical protein